VLVRINAFHGCFAFFKFNSGQRFTSKG